MVGVQLQLHQQLQPMGAGGVVGVRLLPQVWLSLLLIHLLETVGLQARVALQICTLSCTHAQVML